MWLTEFRKMYSCTIKNITKDTDEWLEGCWVEYGEAHQLSRPLVIQQPKSCSNFFPDLREISLQLPPTMLLPLLACRLS